MLDASRMLLASNICPLDYSARRMLSGFFIITSQLERTPTTVTRSRVAATPIRLTEGIGYQGILILYLLISHVSAIAAAEPVRPASNPSTPYSIRVI